MRGGLRASGVCRKPLQVFSEDGEPPDKPACSILIFGCCYEFKLVELTHHELVRVDLYAAEISVS